jgi:TnpA family transposase
LAWLRAAPGEPSPKSINKIVERLLFIRELDLPPVPTTLHQNRVLHLARKCSKLSAQPLLKIASRKRRYSLLLTYLHELSQDFTDQALDQFDKLLADLLRKGERKQDKHMRVNARKINAHLTILTRAAEAFLASVEEGSDAKERVLARVPASVLQQTVSSAKALLRPEDFDSLDLIETRYVPIRKSLFALYQALDFQPLRASEPAIQALNHAARLQKSRKRVTGVQQRVGKHVVATPLGHLTEKWKKHVLLGEEIAPNQYEAAAFEALNARLQSGDVAVGGSRRHQPFEDYLLPKQEFAQLIEKKQTRLAVEGTAEHYLEQKQQEIVEKLARLRQSIGVVPGSLRLDEHGKLQLPPLEKAVPEQAEYHSRRLATFLPRVPLADLLLEVDNWTGFLRHLTHLSTGMATTGSQRLILVAGLMGMGMNYGLSKMADSCPYSYRQLSWSVDWHIREETLLAALSTLDNFVLNLPFARMWGDGTSSSSDGMRIETVVKTPNGVRNARYFGFGKGVTFYSHTADIWMPFGKQQVISTNESEALYVIDALCHHESDLHIREHYTDTGGSTDHVFALAALLGFKFAPRISSSLDKNLYTYQPIGDQGVLNSLIASPVRAKYIVEHWEEMQRVASSIRHGSVSASLLMRRLRAYSRQNRLATALTELGKLERTSFLLDYFQDEALRRRILIGLNKGEALHALARQLFSGKHGELWDRAFEDQMHRASCLHLIMAAIAAWNAVYLSQAVEELKKRGETVPEEYLPHITPLGWEHINLIGQYSFTHQSARSLDNLRPLRLPEQEDEPGKAESPPLSQALQIEKVDG